MTAGRPSGFRRKFFEAFIQPHQLEQPTRNREKVFNIVLFGSGLLVTALLVLLLYSFWFLGNQYVAGRLIVCSVALLYLAGIFWLSRTLHYYTSAYLLVAFYTFIAGGSVAVGGLNSPFGILLFGLVVVLASTMLAARHALYAAALAAATTIAIHILSDGMAGVQETGAPPSTLGDALGFGAVFGVLGVISWLFGREMERSLHRAEQAEAELELEKSSLERRVAERTRQLKKAQVEEMQQLYQFTEAGQLSTALLHDLANHLTVLTLEIEGLQSKKHAAAISRSQHIISHLDKMVDAVRDRLKGKVATRSYDLSSMISQVVEFVQYRQESTDVRIKWTPPSDQKLFTCIGDPFKLSQVITILLNNAVDAYKGIKTSSAKKTVTITLEEMPSEFVVCVTDKGMGIPEEGRDHIFKYAFSTKKSGMGIGLYLAKQMVETQLQGTLRLSPAKDMTEFILSLPKKSDAG